MGIYVEPHVIEFDYVNWKSNRGHRKVEVRGIRFGTSEWYPQPTWLMSGIDLDKGERREYKMANMSNVQGTGL